MNTPEFENIDSINASQNDHIKKLHAIVEDAIKEEALIIDNLKVIEGQLFDSNDLLAGCEPRYLCHPFKENGLILKERQDGLVEHQRRKSITLDSKF